MESSNLKKQNDIRIEQLNELGLIFNGQEFCKDDFNIHWTELTCDNNNEFNRKIECIKKEMKRRMS
jgi:hypothetical protein